MHYCSVLAPKPNRCKCHYCYKPLLAEVAVKLQGCQFKNVNKMYQVMKHEGLGVMECPTVTSGTEFIFRKKKDAERKADELWKENTTEEDRKSGWCPLHYSVRKVNVK